MAPSLQTHGLGSLHPPVPGNPPPRAYDSIVKTRGNAARFSGRGLGLRGPQAPKTMTRGKRFTFLGRVLGGFWETVGQAKPWDVRRFCRPGKSAKGAQPPTRAVHAHPKPSKTRVGATALPGRGLAKTPGQANHRENGPLAPPSKTLSPLILRPPGFLYGLKGVVVTRLGSEQGGRTPHER